MGHWRNGSRVCFGCRRLGVRVSYGPLSFFAIILVVQETQKDKFSPFFFLYNIPPNFHFNQFPFYMYMIDTIIFPYSQHFQLVANPYINSIEISIHSVSIYNHIIHVMDSLPISHISYYTLQRKLDTFHQFIQVCSLIAIVTVSYST